MPANISPLAQTFKVADEFKQGCFVTSVDLFFATVAVGETEPVEVQIVETVNGYPTANILDGAKSIVYPASITASATGAIRTKFRFPTLVHLEPGTEYAIKVISNSLKYKLWTAFMGDKRVDNPAILITQQPALGSLFKSQNNSTWTPEQLQDLSFVLNRAKFNTGVIGNVHLVESPTAEYVYLPPNPFKITNTQTKVKVHHLNHGLVAGMLVAFSGSTDTQFNAKFTVTSVVDSDHYIIKTAAQSATNFVGGANVLTEKVVKYDTIRVTGILEGKESGTKVTSRLSSSTSVDSVDTDIVPDAYIDLAVNKFVHSSINRTNNLAGASSFTLKTQLSSINDAISPIIDLEGLTVQLIGNKINRPSSAVVDYDIDGENVVVGSSNVSFTAATNTITVPVTTDYTLIKEGAWIKVVDAGGSNDGKKGYISSINTTANTLTIVGDALVDQASRSATIVQYTSFISEVCNGGTAESKTITKQVSLTKFATGFRVIFVSNIHTDADIEMYYRTGTKDDAIKLSDTNWTKHAITYKKSANESEFIEHEFNITNIARFDEFQFKFVFLSSNTAVTPKMKQLRIIAHA